MEAGFIPSDTIMFVKWLLQVAFGNDWTIVFEYSIDENIPFLTNNAAVVQLPVTSQLNYDSDCKLIAVKYSILTDNLIDKIITGTHVMTLHDEKEMIFLAADDYHEDCFTCTTSFYNKYYNVLYDKRLILFAHNKKE